MLGTFKQKSDSRQGGRFYHEPILLEVEAEAPGSCDSWGVWQDFDPGQPGWRACLPCVSSQTAWGRLCDLGTEIFPGSWDLV